MHGSRESFVAGGGGGGGGGVQSLDNVVYLLYFYCDFFYRVLALVITFYRGERGSIQSILSQPPSARQRNVIKMAFQFNAIQFNSILFRHIIHTH